MALAGNELFLEFQPQVDLRRPASPPWRPWRAGTTRAWERRAVTRSSRWQRRAA